MRGASLGVLVGAFRAGRGVVLMLARPLLSEPLPLPEWPECEPPGSAIAMAMLGPPTSRNAATTPTPAARRRFAGATVPLLRVAKTFKRRADCILACRSAVKPQLPAMHANLL